MHTVKRSLPLVHWDYLERFLMTLSIENAYKKTIKTNMSQLAAKP